MEEVLFEFGEGVVFVEDDDLVSDLPVFAWVDAGMACDYKGEGCVGAFVEPVLDVFDVEFMLVVFSSLWKSGVADASWKLVSGWQDFALV